MAANTKNRFIQVPPCGVAYGCQSCDSREVEIELFYQLKMVLTQERGIRRQSIADIVSSMILFPVATELWLLGYNLSLDRCWFAERLCASTNFRHPDLDILAYSGHHDFPFVP